MGTEQKEVKVYLDGKFIGTAGNIQTDAQFNDLPEKMISCDIARGKDFTVSGEIKLSDTESRVMWLYVYNMLRKKYLWRWMYHIKKRNLAKAVEVIVKQIRQKVRDK